MGWAGGTDIADGVWDSVKEYIPEDKKVLVANQIIEVLEDQDWDNLQESEELYEISGRKQQDIDDGVYDDEDEE